MTKYLIGSDPNLDASWSTTSGGSADTVKPTSSDDVILDGNSPSATLTANMSVKSFNASAYTNTLTHGAFTITSAGSVTLSAGMTYTVVATSAWVISATATITTAGKLMPLISHTSGTVTQADNVNFMASKVMILTLSGTNWDMNGHDINGNSVTNRILITSNVKGTGRTLTRNGGNFSNADFRDITFSSATDIDLSNISGKSGDCGGNTITGGGTNLIFTPSADQYWSGTSGGNVSTNVFTSRVPLPQDNVFFTGTFLTSQTITVDMPRFGKNIDFSGATNPPSLGASLNFSIFGSLTMHSSQGTSGTFTITFEGRGSHTITSGTNQWGHSLSVDSFGGTYQLQTDVSTGASVILLNGTFDWNHKNIRAANHQTNVTTTRAILNATGRLTLTTAPTIWTINTTNLTFDPSDLEIDILSSSANARTFNLAGLHYGLIQYNANGGALTLSGGGEIDRLRVRPTVAQTINITSGTTVIIHNYDINGSTGKLKTLKSTSGGSPATISTPSGIVSMDYMSIQDITATGGADFYAGTHSTNVSGNTGITFTASPIDGTSIFGDEGLVN